jgi:electron transfer flavoprotein alpha/beta subunit
MEILVCVKRVPDTAENEIEANRDGSDIERDDLVYSVNEWDNYAVEEAIQLVDNAGGAVRSLKRSSEGKWPWEPTMAFWCPMMPLRDRMEKPLPQF